MDDFVVSEVYHNQAMFFVVQVDYVDVPEVYPDETMFFVVYVDWVVIPEIYRDHGLLHRSGHS